MRWRAQLGDILNYDWVPNPILAYTQVCRLEIFEHLLFVYKLESAGLHCDRLHLLRSRAFRASNGFC